MLMGSIRAYLTGRDRVVCTSVARGCVESVDKASVDRVCW